MNLQRWASEGSTIKIWWLPSGLKWVMTITHWNSTYINTLYIYTYIFFTDIYIYIIHTQEVQENSPIFKSVKPPTNERQGCGEKHLVIWRLRMMIAWNLNNIASIGWFHNVTWEMVVSNHQTYIHSKMVFFLVPGVETTFYWWCW